ncbi:hypothetical protein K474DRAFT_1629580 [Panus rudis PR-1116 ss-1]|nr:hypothetical protein K474DRAFT_1629580 [Panus rudis PR-1116 ss-1]
MGYFMFPPPRPPTPDELPELDQLRHISGFTKQPSNPTSSRPDDNQDATDDKENDIPAHQRHFEELRRKRIEREREEIFKSELAWVRSGGVLRDALGRRDKARTEFMRAEIKRLDAEAAILHRWNTYEQRWRDLSSSSFSDQPVTWDDIPWPVNDPPQTLEDLQHDAIESFIFATFAVRGAEGTRRDRIRSSLLRWHPDKVSLLLSRVVEEDRSRVAEGVNAVFRCLKALQDVEKQSS